MKRDLGLPMYDAPNAVEELKNQRKHPTAKKVEAIKDALKYFEIIERRSRLPMEQVSTFVERAN